MQWLKPLYTEASKNQSFASEARGFGAYKLQAIALGKVGTAGLQVIALFERCSVACA